MKRARDEAAPPAAETPAPPQDASASPSPPTAAAAPSSSSPYALHFEVINSITSRRSSSLEAERAAVLSRLLGSATAPSSPVSAASLALATADVAALMEDDVAVCLGGFTRELVHQQLLQSSDEGSLLRLLTVELLANDGRTLVLAAPPPLESAAATATAAAPLLMDLADAGTAEVAAAHPADLLLLRCQPRNPADSEEAGASSSQWATHAEFITYNTSFLTGQDVDLWREAVEGNISTVVRWLAALLEQPPGLAQLAFLEAAASSLTTLSSSRSSGEGWRRALQLPLLLRVKPEVMRNADATTLDRLRRTVFFALRTLLSVFHNVESAMRLPRLTQRLVYLFLASPLFVDGASQVSMQLVSTDAVAATRQSMAETLQSCLQMGLQYASAAAAVMTDAAATTAELRRSVQQARNGFELVLSRVSHVWLLHSASLKSKRAAGATAGPEAAVCEVLEAVAASGVLRHVLRWLQLEEDVRRTHDQADSGRVGDTADAIAELLAPPTLRQLQEGRHLQERTVAEQLAVLRRTYNPYLSHELQQFLKGTAIAAYAELYGNTAAAVRRITKLAEGAAELQNLGRLDGVMAVPLETVEAVGLRPGGLAEYSLTEAQQHAAFGLPVRLNVRTQSAPQLQQLNTLEATLQATRFTAEPGGRPRADASLFACAVVQLNGQWIAFPLVLAQLTREAAAPPEKGRAGGGQKGGKKVVNVAASLVAHVLRDGDMLADFVTTSAAASESGRATAWVVVGEEATVHRRTPRRRRAAAALANASADATAERLLPSGTPALTYMDCLRRLHALSLTVRQCEAGTNSKRRSGGATGPVDRPFDPNSATGLWTEHFLDGAVPQQRYVGALTATVSSILSGGEGSAVAAGGGARQTPGAATTTTSLQKLLASVNGAVRFSSAQVEALYSLTAGSGLSGAPAAPPTRPGAAGSSGTAHHSNVPVAVKVVDGCTGSGKTSILYASGLLRGKLHAVARQEQQRMVQARLKQRNAALRQATTELRRAAVAELFTTSPELRGGRNLLEEASRIAAEARQQYQMLNEGFLYCSTPFMLRPAAVTSTVPEAVEELLFHSKAASRAEGEQAGDDEAAASRSVWARSEVNSIATLLRESYERSLKAPLTAQLNAQLELVLATGTWSGRCRAADVVAAPLLALTMSAREAADVMARASPSSPASWAAFLAEEVWPDSGVVASLQQLGVPEAAEEDEQAEQDLAPAAWEVLTAAPESRFSPVSLPDTTHLSAMSAEQLEGWHSVYLEKQAELAQHIHTAVHESVKSLFQFFVELVYGVAATSQSTRHTLVTATPVELTQGMQLPYLWCWQPSHVCIDDLDAVQDGVFAMLTPASSVVYSLTAEVPAFQERRRSHERVVLALLRSLRTDLQRVGALTTTALRESLRCRRPEVQSVLRYSIEDSRVLAKPLEESTEKEDGADEEGKDGEEGAAQQQHHHQPLHEQRKLDLAAPPPAFPGLASYSAVEVWSHGVSPDKAIAADAVAAVFLMSHLSSYRRRRRGEGPLSFGIYTNTAAAAETVSEAIAASSSSQVSLTHGLPPPPPSVRVWKESLEDMGSETSFAAATNVASVAYTNLEEAECETDVGIVCLSGLLEVMKQALKGNPASGRSDVRRQQWRQLWAESADGTPSLFVTRLQWWLWRLLRRVRLGVFFLGSRELFACVPLFTRVEAFVQLQRRQLSPKDDRAYWLPPEVGASVLAMVCPDHYKCRRTATVQEREAAEVDEEAEELEELPVEVQTRGAETCRTLCLQPHERCPNPSHACLHTCHAQKRLPPGDATSTDAPAVDAEDADADFHACCPYPCGNVLPCGHICHKLCGLSCEPCAYAGLRELACGQRVVSGIDGSKALQYTVFHHFQQRRCGEATALCRTPVSVPCPRCGTRTLIACHRVTAQAARQRHAAAEEERQGGDVDGAVREEAYAIGETACAGCVALYNKVAAKFGYEPLPLPPHDLTLKTSAGASADDHHDAVDAHGGEEEEEEDEEDDDGDVPGAPLPRHTLSAEAQAELRRELTIASKKVELLAMKEALEISSGRATDKTDYAVYRARYEALRVRQAEQERAWREAYKAEMDACAVKLRKALEVQYALNTELDTMMPRLLSDATDEAEVQRLRFIE